MKQRLQSVAILAIGLLALQPVLAGLPCALGMAESCAAGCPMAMNGMAPDCPMMGGLTAVDCPSDCCTHALPQVAAFPAAPERLKFTAIAPSVVLPAAILAPEKTVTPQASLEARIASPPRCILNQVFRI